MLALPTNGLEIMKIYRIMYSQRKGESGDPRKQAEGIFSTGTGNEDTE